MWNFAKLSFSYSPFLGRPAGNSSEPLKKFRHLTQATRRFAPTNDNAVQPKFILTFWLRTVRTSLRARADAV